MAEFITVLRVKPGGKHLCLLLGEVIELWAHWVEKEKQSAACIGSGCRFCPGERKWRGYLPVIQYQGMDTSIARPVPRYVKAILEIGPNAMQVLSQRDYVGLEQVFLRDKNRFSALEVQTPKHGRVLPDIPSWDIRPAIMRMWGLSSLDQVIDDSVPDVIPFRKREVS